MRGLLDGCTLATYTGTHTSKPVCAYTHMQYADAHTHALAHALTHKLKLTNWDLQSVALQNTHKHKHTYTHSHQLTYTHTTLSSAVIHAKTHTHTPTHQVGLCSHARHDTNLLLLPSVIPLPTALSLCCVPLAAFLLAVAAAACGHHLQHLSPPPAPVKHLYQGPMIQA
jgi:hypothetical protein